MNDKKLILFHLTSPERCTATNSNFSTKLLQGSNFLRKVSKILSLTCLITKLNPSFYNSYSLESNISFSVKAILKSSPTITLSPMFCPNTNEPLEGLAVDLKTTVKT